MAAQIDEELYPALLDRIVDDTPVVERVRLRFRAAEVAKARLDEKGVRSLLVREGLRPVKDGVRDEEPGIETYETSDAARRAKAVLATRVGNPRSASRPVLGELVDVLEIRRVDNAAEVARLSGRGMRDIRGSILQNLAWLLNTRQFMDDESLAEYPEVRNSVLDYGIPAIAGNTSSSISAQDVCEGIQSAIQRFEPRLTDVSVTPVESLERDALPKLGFRIEATVLGPASSERFDIRTALDLESKRFDLRKEVG